MRPPGAEHRLLWSLVYDSFVTRCMHASTPVGFAKFSAATTNNDEHRCQEILDGYCTNLCPQNGKESSRCFDIQECGRCWSSASTGDIVMKRSFAPS